MATIFISYRRDDAPGYAGRLYDRLRQEFGRNNVFIDVDALQPGDDFVDAIQEKLAKCDLMLVIIGRRWLSVSDAQGRRRLEETGDYVRLEIQAALDRHVRTVPVLVEQGSMPRAEDLPEPLRALARRQAIELSDTRWDYDVSTLVESLKRAAASPTPAVQITHASEHVDPVPVESPAGVAVDSPTFSPPQDMAASPGRAASIWWKWAAGLALALAALAGGWFWSTRDVRTGVDTIQGETADFYDLSDGLRAIRPPDVGSDGKRRAASSTSPGKMVGGQPPEWDVRCALVTTNFFDVWRETPALGRLFVPDDKDRIVAIISFSTWSERFGARPEIIGQGIRVNDQLYTVVGVAAEHFASPSYSQVWVTVLNSRTLSPPEVIKLHER